MLCKLGFAEFDDVFDNTMGAAIGAVVVLILINLRRSRDDKREERNIQ